MDAFSYLSVLLSIIIGLGLTQLLTAAGLLIRHRDRVTADWLPLAWAAALFVIFVQVWWSMFGLRMYRDWTFFAFLLVLSQTASLYMMAAVALPDTVADAGVRLAEHYERQRRWFFGFFLLTLTISIVKDLVLNGSLPNAINVSFHALEALVCVVGITARRRRIQEGAGVIGIAALVAYVALLFTRLG